MDCTYEQKKYVKKHILTVWGTYVSFAAVMRSWATIFHKKWFDKTVNKDIQFFFLKSFYQFVCINNWTHNVTSNINTQLKTKIKFCDRTAEMKYKTLSVFLHFSILFSFIYFSIKDLTVWQMRVEMTKINIALRYALLSCRVQKERETTQKLSEYFHSID